MNQNSFSTRWYFNELPNLENVLKTELIHQKEKKGVLIVEDYFNIFFDFFENYSAFKFFAEDLVNSDEFYLSVNFKFGQSMIHFTRRFWLNPDFDEEFFQQSYQVSLDLDLSIKYDHESFEESFEIKRDKNEEFFIHGNKKDFSGFKGDVLRNRNLGRYLRFTPATVRKYIRADV